MTQHADNQSIEQPNSTLLEPGTQPQPLKVALITGSAKRLGRQIAITLHENNYNVVIHYHHSQLEAQNLINTLNAIRANSAQMICANLTDTAALPRLVVDTMACYQRIDLLVNNASSFYPNPIQPDNDAWLDLTDTNMKAPYFLSSLFYPHLAATDGNIVCLVDIHADKPLKQHTIYCMAKAGLKMMIKSLACEFAPSIRVNGVSPGAILWPEQAIHQQSQQSIIQQIALKRIGDPSDIANTVLFLANSPYITGQVITVDGGRSLLGANIA